FAVLAYLPFASIMSCGILMRQRPHGLGMFAESRLLSEWRHLPYLLRQLLLHYFAVAKRSLTIMSANESLDSTGFCAWLLPLGFSVLMISPPVSQLGRSAHIHDRHEAI